MRSLVLAAALAIGCTLPALAQTDMSCADYVKSDEQMKKQMSAADRAALTADPTAAAMDRKMLEYCAKNPRATAAEAMEKAIGG